MNSDSAGRVSKSRCSGSINSGLIRCTLHRTLPKSVRSGGFGLTFFSVAAGPNTRLLSSLLYVFADDVVKERAVIASVDSRVDSRTK